MEPTPLLRKNNKILQRNVLSFNAKLIFFAGFKGVGSQAGDEIRTVEIRRPIDEKNGGGWTHFDLHIVVDAEAPLTTTPRGERSGRAGMSLHGAEGRGAA